MLRGLGATAVAAPVVARTARAQTGLRTRAKGQLAELAMRDRNIGRRSKSRADPARVAELPAKARPTNGIHTHISRTSLALFICSSERWIKYITQALATARTVLERARRMPCSVKVFRKDVYFDPDGK
eukprot:6188961-Pleurochrysis_carterae.AAC.3